MGKFSRRYEIIYDFFMKRALERQEPSGKIDMARLLGVTQGKAQKWEKGQIPIAVDCLSINKKLGFELEWLISGDGPMFRSTETGSEAEPEASPDITELLLENRQLRIELDRLRRVAAQKNFEDVPAHGTTNAAPSLPSEINTEAL